MAIDTWAMQFAGRVYFDFRSPAVWTFFRLLGAAAAAGVELRTDWHPFVGDPADDAIVTPLAAYEAVRHRDPDRHGAFLLALLTAVHVGGNDPTDRVTLQAACEAAGIDPSAVDGAEAFTAKVSDRTAEATELGVTVAPTVYRHGPVLHVVLTPAALRGDPVARLQAIDAVLEDDAIWKLEKP